MIKATEHDSWIFCLMYCESMKNEQIPIMALTYKAKVETNIDACKSNQ